MIEGYPKAVEVKDTEILVYPPKPAVCIAEVLPGTYICLEKWPSRWIRFWHWVFFGVKWEALDDE